MPAHLSCIHPDGHFRYSLHQPSYTTINLRQNSHTMQLGACDDGQPVVNTANFPTDDVKVPAAGWVYEIANPLPFRGSTYISKDWADARAAHPEAFQLPPPPELSLHQTLASTGIASDLIDHLPRPLQLALATSSTDPADLTRLARCCCSLRFDANGEPSGFSYQRDQRGKLKPVITDHQLLEAVANNPCLPDTWKQAMVLRPGAQGTSPVVGDWSDTDCNTAYEYLRENSYIAGGHYAANMADDRICYRISDLRLTDMLALRHLYYQRQFVQTAALLGMPLPVHRQRLPVEVLEQLRQDILARLPTPAPALASLWGWNFGFDFAPSGHRLHASHQQIHQQYALVQETVKGFTGKEKATALATFSAGDQVSETVAQYMAVHRRDFFADYRRCITSNQRCDGRNEFPGSLIVWQNAQVMLMVPKAQTSPWELQIMTLPDKNSQLPGNIWSCDQMQRRSLDVALYLAQQILARLGARLVTSSEYGKRLGSPLQQALLYVLLPRLPETPPTFSDMQLRSICGHYPEDFAAACRAQLTALRLDDIDVYP